MKNKLLPLLFVIGSYSAYSQVVIGKKEVTPSAQLEVFASDKGMLIPNVELTSTLDRTTIKNGNVNSLLVFNTKTIADVIPGYYYWYNNRWNKFIISGESNGIATGTGVPGNKGEAGYPGENVSLYTDKASGTVYVQNADGTWASINGKNGLDGRNGIAGGNGVPGALGTPAVDNTVQMYIDYNTGTVYVRDPKDPNKWITVSGLDGIAGATGAPGTAGSITTLDAIVKDPNGNIYAYVGENKTVAGRDAEWASKSPNWVKINGLDGRDGKDGVIGGKGVPGAKGEAGYPGDSVAMYIDNETGTVYVRDPKNPDKWIPLTGKNGIDGIPGVDGAPGTAGSITTLDAIVKDPNGDIYAYVGEDKTVAGRDAEWASKSPNWVKINGLNGKDGITGANGEPGAAGSITTLDAIVKSPSGDIYAYVGEDKTVAGRDAEWASKSPNWVKINGLNGKDGITGANGEPGAAGSITTLDAIVKSPSGDIYAYVGENKTVAGRDAEWAAKSPNWVKINGLDGKDGKDGVIGGKGAPGAKGEANYPGDNVAIYIDNETGTVYIHDPKNPDNWIALTGKNGIDGIKGVDGVPGEAGKITTLDAIVKDPEGNIYAYVGEDKTVAGRDAEWASKSPNWVKINGLNGKDGITGANGEPGAAGSITTLDAIVKSPNGDIYAYVGEDKTVAGRDAEWASKSPNWVKINGLDGRDGKDGVIGGKGAPGAKGEAGYPGDNIAMYIDNETGTVYVRDPKDPDKWIPLTGKNGIDGIPGVDGAPGTAGSITTLDAIVKDPNGDIYAYVGEDKTVAGRDAEWASKSPNWVKINGLNGKDGITGANGEPGAAGSITTLDAIVKSPSGDIYAYVGTDKTVAGRDAEWAAKSPNWVKINGMNGADGIAGATGAPGTAGSITTLDAIVKDPNGDIYAYVGTDKTVAGRDAEWAAKSPNWVKINGMNGADGIAGATGAPGTAGSITTLDAIVKDPNGIIYAYVGTDKTVAGRDAEWAAKSPNWVPLNGKNGIDGKNGISGGNGAPGTAGAPAVDDTVQMYIDYSTGTVYVRDPQDNTKWVPANKETLTSLVFDEASNKLTYTNENSVANVIDLGKAIAAGETKTTLSHNATTNKLTYVGEGETDIINLADITTTTPDTVLEVTGTGATFKAATVNIVPSAVVGDVLTTSETGVVAWKATVKPNVLGIVATSDDYTVKADDYTIIANKLTKDITIKLPNAADNKGRIIVINQHNVVIPNTDTAVQVKFDVNVIYSDTDQYPYIAASLFGGVSKGSAKITLQSDGENWYVITYTM